ncbi:MAG: ogr/Delta-like zinc finger family protein [Desulfovibrionaceae bacterium]|jgi:hypothetical protein|nr:ogr/Delta-like zinc finger family protein [Desulfovibrionaceae bacterium]
MHVKMHCPHCRTMCIVRSSSVLTRTSRELFFVCMNIDCGHTFSAVMEINRTISPSAIPDPTVVLPMSKHIKRNLLAEQLQRMPVSDYEPDRTGQTGELFEQTWPPRSPAAHGALPPDGAHAALGRPGGDVFPAQLRQPHVLQEARPG